MNKIILFIRILNCRNVVSHCNLFGRNTTVHVNQLRYVKIKLIGSTNFVLNVFRFMSIGSTPKLPQEKPRRSVSIDEFRNFMAVFPELVKDLTESGHYSDTPDVNKWIEKVWNILLNFLCNLFLLLNFYVISCCNTTYQMVRKTVD